MLFSSYIYMLQTVAINTIFFQQLFHHHGGVLYDGQKVIAVHPGAVVTVVTNQGRYRAKKVVLNPGPWAKDLLQATGVSLPLQASACLLTTTCSLQVMSVTASLGGLMLPNN